MRKWGCHFDVKNVYAFLERLEELQRAYQFTDQQILRGFTELLKGDSQPPPSNPPTPERTVVGAINNAGTRE